MVAEHGAEASGSLKMFGAVLKSLRDQGGLTQEEFGLQVQYSAPYVAKIEQGKRFPPADLPARVAGVLGEDAAKVLTAAAKTLTRRSGLATWFQQWAGIEEEAISLWAYECRVIPGLLQPEGYIRAVFDQQIPPLSEEQFERQVAARLERQRILDARPNTAFSFLIEEAVLRRGLGGVEVTRDVVRNLLEQGSRRNVEILLMPLQQVDHCGVDGQMYLAERDSHQWVGYIEGHECSTLLTQPKLVSSMLQRYGKMRSQALSHLATADVLRDVQGAL
ncbi:XRE family transcriptional regulator [Streptomyces griseoluteus]|uniref:XRE family transcriptional regulator n=1 Tax=Streptomyces griseoluteus TaxID=29306 RepID=A0A4Z1DP71_STRGP|nr:Scr1 family TA system antitoxin-like transcriptional regulator [Streptomyces griseoluteus]TGN86140.1 XRE family transcriptional regulator [Streptomyces griseoluteus]GHE88403.1 transcriptional regulator [Streptomyces griseoluteus]